MANKINEQIIEGIKTISESTDGNISFECNSDIEPTFWWFQKPTTKITTVKVTIKEQI